jgi:hypothetical protein
MITINGLPAHILLVHLVVVLLPLTSAMAVLGSIWPAAQRKFTFLTPLAALVGLIAVPITVAAGEQLADRLQLGAAIAEHEMLAERILPLVIALFVTTAGQWAYLRFARRRRWVTVVIAVLVIAAALATTVQVVLTGDAGAHAVWGSIKA